MARNITCILKGAIYIGSKTNNINFFNITVTDSIATEGAGIYIQSL